jgi:tetratricopeptide (TPR) repeat protein
LAKQIFEELLHVDQFITEGKNDNALELLTVLSKRKDLSDEDKFTCSLLESRINLNLGQIEKANEGVEKTWLSIRKRKNPILILDCSNIKVNLTWLSGEIDEGIKLFEERLSLIKKIQHKVTKDKEEFFKKKKAEFFKNGGILHWYKGNLDTALEIHKGSLDLGEEIKNKHIILDSTNNIGLVYWSKGDLEKAIEHYNYALRISEELGLKHKEAIILSNIGNVYSLKGELGRASEILQKSLEIKRKLGNKREIAVSIINVGVVFQLKGEIDKALDYYQEALLISEEVDSKSNIALALNNIGSIYSLKGDPNSAVEYLERSLKLYKELGIKEKIALLYGNIGGINRLKGDMKEAFDNFNQSLILYEEIGNNHSSAIILLELVQEAIVKNDSELIQRYLRKLEELNKLSDARSIDQQYRMAKALSLKMSNQTRSQTKAIVLFEQIIEEEVVNHELKVKAMVNLCDMLIRELTLTANAELLEEIKELLLKLHSIAEEQSSNSILAETYRLEALLALAELDLKKARNSLQKGLNLAEEKKLESIASNIREDQINLDEQIQLWEELKERKAPLEETLQYVKIEKSMNQLKQEETITYKKLFSLKI